MDHTAGPSRQTEENRANATTPPQSANGTASDAESQREVLQPSTTSPTSPKNVVNTTIPETALPTPCGLSRGLNTTKDAVELEGQVLNVEQPVAVHTQSVTPTVGEDRVSTGASVPTTSNASATILPQVARGSGLIATAASSSDSGHIADVNTETRFVYLSGSGNTESVEQERTGRGPKGCNLNGYNLFTQYRVAELKNSGVEVGKNLMTIMSEEWHMLSKDERASWNEKAHRKNRERAARLAAGLPLDEDEEAGRKNRRKTAGPSTVLPDENAPQGSRTAKTNAKRKRTTVESGPSTRTVVGDKADSQWKRLKPEYNIPFGMKPTGPFGTYPLEPIPVDELYESTSYEEFGRFNGLAEQYGAPVPPYTDMAQSYDSTVQHHDEDRTRTPAPSNVLADDPPVSSDSPEVSETRWDLGPSDIDFWKAMELLLEQKYVEDPSGEDVGDVPRTPATDLSVALVVDVDNAPATCINRSTETSNALAAIDESTNLSEPFATSATDVSATSGALNGSNTSTAPASNLREEYGPEPEKRLIPLPSSRQLISQMLADSMTIHPQVTKVSSYSSLSNALRND